MAALPDDDPLRLVLAGYHDAARRDTVEALESRHVKRLLARWHTVLADLRSEKKHVSSEVIIDQQRRRVLRAAATVGLDAPSADLHRLRRRIKELRYVLEMFVGPERKPVRKVLKKVQEALGDVQDAAVQRAWLAEHADEVGPIDVRLNELDEREAVARAAFVEQFASFLASAETLEDERNA
jgi:CHAD domain-containing protein